MKTTNCAYLDICTFKLAQWVKKLGKKWRQSEHWKESIFWKWHTTTKAQKNNMPTIPISWIVSLYWSILFAIGQAISQNSITPLEFVVWNWTCSCQNSLKALLPLSPVWLNDVTPLEYVIPIRITNWLKGITPPEYAIPSQTGFRWNCVTPLEYAVHILPVCEHSCSILEVCCLHLAREKHSCSTNVKNEQNFWCSVHHSCAISSNPTWRSLPTFEANHPTTATWIFCCSECPSIWSILCLGGGSQTGRNPSEKNGAKNVFSK